MKRRGWVALCLAGALGIGGRVLGAPELYVLATTIVVLVVAATAYVRAARSQLGVARRVQPTRAHVGSAARVDLELRNEGRRRSGVVSLRDGVSGTRGASLMAAPIDGGSAVRASYALPTERRGVLRIGPLTVERTDPLDLASSSVEVAGTVEVTVYPRIERIRPTALTSGNDPLAGSEHPDALGRRGDDFYALRPYVVGDDLRRVHWPSTARHDDLMIRQEEIPWQGRVTVLLDDRPGRCSPDTFELMVSAAASVAFASGQRQDLLRLVTTRGVETGFGAGHQHVEGVMEQLATVDIGGDPPSSVAQGQGRGADGSGQAAAPLEATLLALDAGASPGALVAVVGDLPIGELVALRQAGRRFGAVHVVRFAAAMPGVEGRHHLGTPGEVRSPFVDVGPGRPFASAWDEAMIEARVSVTR